MHIRNWIILLLVAIVMLSGCTSQDSSNNANGKPQQTVSTTVVPTVKEVDYSGIKQGTSNLIIKTNMGFITGDFSNGVMKKIMIYLTVPDGGQPAKLDETEFLWSINGKENVKLTPSQSIDSYSKLETNVVNALNEVKVTLPLPAGYEVNRGDTFKVEVKPKIGAPSILQRTLEKNRELIDGEMYL